MDFYVEYEHVLTVDIFEVLQCQKGHPLDELIRHLEVEKKNL
jgi:hypothetical protein